MDKDKALQKIANTLYITTQCIPSIGLMTGKMGIAIFLYQYSRISSNIDYNNLADSLLDTIYPRLYKNTPKFFSEGIAGIGWGLNFLMQEKYVEADDNILEEVDDVIRKTDKNRFIVELNEELPLFSKGIYLIARKMKEDLPSCVCELESFLSSVELDNLPYEYTQSVKYFLSRMETEGIEEDRCKALSSKLPIIEGKDAYWNQLIYENNVRLYKDSTAIYGQINNLVTNIRYSSLGLHNGLAGLGIVLL